MLYYIIQIVLENLCLKIVMIKHVLLCE